MSAIIADTTTKAFVTNYPTLLIVLAVIGIVALMEHIFMVGMYFGKRGKK